MGLLFFSAWILQIDQFMRLVWVLLLLLLLQLHCSHSLSGADIERRQRASMITVHLPRLPPPLNGRLVSSQLERCESINQSINVIIRSWFFRFCVHNKANADTMEHLPAASAPGPAPAPPLYMYFFFSLANAHLNIAPTIYIYIHAHSYVRTAQWVRNLCAKCAKRFLILARLDLNVLLLSFSISLLLSSNSIAIESAHSGSMFSVASYAAKEF